MMEWCNSLANTVCFQENKGGQIKLRVQIHDRSIFDCGRTDPAWSELPQWCSWLVHSLQLRIAVTICRLLPTKQVDTGAAKVLNFHESNLTSSLRGSQLADGGQQTTSVTGCALASVQLLYILGCLSKKTSLESSSSLRPKEPQGNRQRSWRDGSVPLLCYLHSRVSEYMYLKK